MPEVYRSDIREIVREELAIFSSCSACEGRGWRYDIDRDKVKCYQCHGDGESLTHFGRQLQRLLFGYQEEESDEP